MSYTFEHKHPDDSKTIFIFNVDMSDEVEVVRFASEEPNGELYELSKISGEALIALFTKYKHLLP